MRLRRFLLPSLAVLLALPLPLLAGAWSGEVTDFKGYRHHAFEYDGLKCRVVLPEQAAEGKPWIWRARFFGHRPEVDLALLAKGFHLAYVDVANLYGSPEAVDRWDRFYRYLTTTHGLHPKPALEEPSGAQSA